MNIHTNLVKSKRFTSSIEPSILKHSQEYRVLATLRYVYPEKFDAMITGETPDLQDSTSSTGIEVTVSEFEIIINKEASQGLIFHSIQDLVVTGKRAVWGAVNKFSFYNTGSLYDSFL